MEYGEGAKRIGLYQDLQRRWAFHTQQFPVCIKNGPPSKEYPANLTPLWKALDSTWASISLECFRNLLESMHQQFEAIPRKMFLS
jgi:hypothetical protein